MKKVFRQSQIQTKSRLKGGNFEAARKERISIAVNFAAVNFDSVTFPYLNFDKTSDQLKLTIFL